MKIRIHWGTGIAIFFTFWVLFLVGSFVFSAFQNPELVEDEYYQKEIRYQQYIDRVKTTKKLQQQITIAQGDATLALQFPKTINSSDISGEILMYRPSNSRLDKKISVKVTEDNVQVIDIRDMAKGLWKLKIDWSAAGVAYYTEESVTFN